MNSTKQSALQLLRRAIRQTPKHPKSRRWAHDEATKEHGHHGPSHHVEQSESFGRSFYLALALFPTCYVVYSLSRPDKDGSPSSLTRFISSISSYGEYWQRRNELHTRMVEQAGHDRNLFFNTPRVRHHELRFPESFSMGSPIAVPAGHNTNLDNLISHYREKAFKDEEEKLQRMRDGKLIGQEPWQS